MNIIQLKVSGMTCQQCVEKIETSVDDIAGVERTLVDLSASNVIVEYHPEQLKLEEIDQTIETLGYHVEKTEIKS